VGRHHQNLYTQRFCHYFDRNSFSFSFFFFARNGKFQGLGHRRERGKEMDDDMEEIVKKKKV
jgi:hypothetical protein